MDRYLSVSTALIEAWRDEDTEADAALSMDDAELAEAAARLKGEGE